MQIRRTRTVPLSIFDDAVRIGRMARVRNAEFGMLRERMRRSSGHLMEIEALIGATSAGPELDTASGYADTADEPQLTS